MKKEDIEIVRELFKLGAINLESLTENETTDLCDDLQVIIADPKLLKKISQRMWQKAEELKLNYKSVCGVPYTALSIATCISVDHNKPMLIRRKEAKDYGTKKKVEGDCAKGSPCLIIEDVVTTGSSVQETVDILHEVGVSVTDAVVLLDCNRTSKENFENIKLHSILTLTDIKEVLKEKLMQHQKVQENQAENHVAKQLFDIMLEKKSNICFSADVDSFPELLKLAITTGPYICCIKIHIDTLKDFSTDNIEKLKQLSREHHFLIFEDRKFADIGNTVKSQFSGGIYKIASWCDITSAHCLPGPGVLDGLKESLQSNEGLACLLIAEMNCEGNLADAKYKESVVKMASKYKEFVIGFICTCKASDHPSHIHFTPGVTTEKKSPRQQFLNKHDCVHIISAPKITEEIKKIQEEEWNKQKDV